ncbi:hypothetical protein [Bacillus alkalicellulosilyticus]|uniref:hypothetical protein n=1 Tax=Alkalihalobacterium alkalicellulosilyticum TaxID=1912214 RepID=UPI000997755A|nr:hypothetical protein [Bacillus alkalicellulosilyticus]
MELTIAHWMYLVGTCLIIVTMLFRQNVVVPAILMTFVVGWLYTGSFTLGLQSIFNASVTAATQLFHIFLIIAIMTALLHALKAIGSDKQMIVPFQKVMNNGHTSFWILVFVTYAISLFFWPAPAVPLIGALLIPVAIKAGLPPIGAALAISIAGHGMALSSDFVIQAAPALTASVSGLEAGAITEKTLIMSLITGAVALLIVYFTQRKEIKKPSQELLSKWENQDQEDNLIKTDDSINSTKSQYSFLFAVLVPIVFLAIVIYVVLATFTSAIPSMEGGAGAALIGGTAAILIIATAFAKDFKSSLEDVSSYIRQGLMFAFKVMGVVIPIAGFFFIGSGDYSPRILGVEADSAPAFLFDLVNAGQHAIPENTFITAFGILLLGMVSGLDGSGFSGLPLIGGLADAFGQTVGVDGNTLAAIGQMGAIWVGGGTLVAWSPIIAIAGFAKISVIDLVRKSFFPVIIGLTVSTIFALLFL